MDFARTWLLPGTENTSIRGYYTHPFSFRHMSFIILLTHVLYVNKQTVKQPG